MRRNTKIVLFSCIVLFLCTILVWGREAKAEEDFSLGNTPEIILNGGTIVHTEDDSVYYVEKSDGYIYYSKGTEQGLFAADAASGLNIIDGRLYYIAAHGQGSVIRQRDLESREAVDLLVSDGEITQLYVTSMRMAYYLSQGEIYKFDLEEKNVEKYSGDSSIHSFIPVRNGYIYAKGQFLQQTIYYNEKIVFENVSHYYLFDGHLILISSGETYQVDLLRLESGDNPAGIVEAYDEESFSTLSAYSLEEEECQYCENGEGEIHDEPALMAATYSNGGISAYDYASDKQKNIVKRARQMLEIQWTPLQDIVGWDADSIFAKGETYIGLPYGQPIDGVFVPWGTSLTGFIKAVNNIQSKMYTDYSEYATVRAPYYSCDCSSFVSWAWNLTGRRTTRSLPTYGDRIASDSIFNLQIGDAFIYPGNHAVLVSDIGYDTSGMISYIDIAEQTPPQTKVTRYGSGGSRSLEALQTQYWNCGYTIYRLKSQYSVEYTHACVVPIDDRCDQCALLAAPPIANIEQTEASSIRLDWKSVTGAYAYVIMRSTEKYGTYDWINTVSSEILQYTDTNLKAGNTYYYKVCALNYINGSWVSGNESDSVTISLIKAPVNLQVVSESSSELKLSWDEVNGAELYGIMRAEKADGIFEWIGASEKTTYVDTGRIVGKEYYYKVYAARYGSNGWINSGFSAVKSGHTTVGTVHNIIISSGAEAKSVKLTWEAVESAYAYGVMRSEDEDGLYSWIATAGENSYIDKGLDTTKSYYYKVFAMTYVDGEWVCGKESESVEFSFLKIPQNLKTESLDEGGVQITWTGVPQADVYGVMRAADPDGPYEWLVAVGDTKYIDKEAVPGKAYYYKVYAARYINGSWDNGESSQSQIGVEMLPEIQDVKTEPGAGIRAIKLSWKPVDNSSVYAVLRSEDANGVYEWITATADTTYTDENLQQGKTYYYKLYASVNYDGIWYNGKLNSETAGNLLLAPKGIKVSSRNGNALAVSWDEVRGASGYEVYVAKTMGGALSKAAVVDTNEYVYTGLHVDDIRYFVLQSLCTVDGKTGIGESSAYIKGVVDIAVPTIVSIRPGGGNYAIKVSWNSVEAAQTYGVLRSESETGTYEWIGATQGLSYTDSGLDPDKTYYYKVYATRIVDGNWKDGMSSEVESGTVCPGPKNISVETSSSSSVKITWSEVSGASAYAVYRVENGGLHMLGTTSYTEFDDTALEFGGTYTYLIQSMVYEDGRWGVGGTSDYGSETIEVGLISGAAASVNQETGEVILEWKKAPGAEYYGILRAEAADGEYIWCGGGTDTVFRDNTCQFGKVYYYKIYGATFRNGRWYNGENCNAIAVKIPNAANPLGIDVSYHNGKIDWNQVAQSQVRFAMIRIGYRRNADGVIIEDVRAAENLKGALEAGLEVGVYFFSTAITEEEVQEEVQWVLNYIKDYPITYPVAYDCEGYEKDTSRMYLAGLTKEQRTGYAEVFLNSVSAAGYMPMMYGSKYHLINSWNIERLEPISQVWVAQWPSTVPVYPQVGTTTYSRVYKMWQYTDRGTVPGISGNVDMNIYYK